MKKLNSTHMTRFVQVAAIAYLGFVLLADIMKWQSLDNTYMVLAICTIAVTSGSLKRQDSGKEK